MNGLQFAAGIGKEEVIEELVKRGVPIEQSELGNTPLYIASLKGHTNIVKFLIEKGANVNTKFVVDESTPLLVAVQEGKVEIVKLLLENTTDKNISTKMTSSLNVLPFAIQKQHWEIVRLFIGDKEAIDHALKVRFHDGSNVLIVICLSGDFEIFNAFFERFSGDINQKTTSGITSLWAAAVGGNVDIAKALVKSGADLHVKSEKNISILLASLDAKKIEIWQNI